MPMLIPMPMPICLWQDFQMVHEFVIVKSLVGLCIKFKVGNIYKTFFRSKFHLPVAISHKSVRVSVLTSYISIQINNSRHDG